MQISQRLKRLREFVTVDELPVTLLAVWTVYYSLRVHWHYIELPYEANVDEGYALTIGQRMLHGRMLPFVDGVAHTGPLFLYSGALIAWFGEFSWLPVRWVAACSFAAMVLLTYITGKRAGHGLAGAIGSVALPVFALLTIAPWDGIAYNAETPVNLFILAACNFVMNALSSPGSRVHLWAGAAALCAVLGAMSKQVGSLHFAVVALAIAIGLAGRVDLTGKQRWRAFATFTVAAITPVALLLSWFAINDGLDDLRYYVSTYNRVVYMHYAIPHYDALKTWFLMRPIQACAVAALLGFGAAQMVATRSRATTWREVPAQTVFFFMVTAFALVGMVGARASQRDFDHYYILTLPWLGLLIGLLADLTLRDVRGWTRFAAQSAMILPLVWTLETTWEVKVPTLGAWSAQKATMLPLGEVDREPPMCKLIQQYAREDQPIFVWGFRPELYVSCKRHPASRFVFTSFVAGHVPWQVWQSKEDEDRLAVPGSRELLMRELEETKPPVIVDCPRSLSGRPMDRYDELRAYLFEHYNYVDQIDGDKLYVRKP